MDAPATPDDDLLAAKAGDEEAFARVYRATQPGLLRYVRVLAGADAEDVCAEAWLQACRDLASFRGNFEGFKGWIARIARNRTIDLARASQRRPADPVAPAELSLVADEVVTPTGEESALVAITTDAALALIASLPRDQAEAVLLRAVLGLDAKTAGQVLGKRPGAVRTAAYRGLQTLARRLTEA